MTYDEVSGSIQRIAIPGSRTWAVWAWVPNRAAFVGTDLRDVILFQRDASGNGYTPTPIRSARGGLPLYCSWSPQGEWLAVNCLDQTKATGGELWLYKLGDTALRETGVTLDYRTLIWENESLLYGTKDDAILTIKLTREKASVVHTTPVLGDLRAFYGMFDEQPLFRSSGGIRLGFKTLAELDRPTAKFRVIGTEKVILISASPRLLIAFDAAGNRIAGTNPGRLIRFGSVKDPNTVYGWADSSLVRLSVEKGSLKIQTVADLGRVAETGPDR